MSDNSPVEVLPPAMRPRCEWCNEPLPLFRWRDSDWAKAKGYVYGRNGDNVFCGLNRGYNFGVSAASREFRGRPR